MELVAAVGRMDPQGRLPLGLRGTMPWSFPEDLAFFREHTLGHTLLMGRKTYEGIGRPLPGRTTLVLTRDLAWEAPGVRRVTSLKEALEVAPEDLQVVGGAEVYTLALPRASQITLSRLPWEGDADAYFPHLPSREWTLHEVTPRKTFILETYRRSEQ